ncbi:HAD-IA family hydrolase [Sphingomonas sp. 28-63-12]|uniref:HAD-IA family hydrolase n=1 Tax=Sphingomonas sp. 28-63-12 TaxID=1970434 RepID=UPI000BCB9617|nr:MAG: hypothetical protein B7Y47_10000 [Sphingomonas sp. 28-63-12]
MPIGALLFDLDGTLVDSAADIARALSIVSRARGGPLIDAAVVRPLVSLGASVLVRRALGTVAGDDAADLGAFRTALGSLPPDPTIVFDGVEPALAALADAGFAMAIVTNKPEALSRQLLRGLGLDRYFMAIVGGDSAKLPKPDRSPLDLALQQMAMTPDRAIMVGDSEIDAAAARACAIPFILYTLGYGAAGCRDGDITQRFHDFSLLPGVIRQAMLDIGKPTCA